MLIDKLLVLFDPRKKISGIETFNVTGWICDCPRCSNTQNQYKCGGAAPAATPHDTGSTKNQWPFVEIQRLSLRLAGRPSTVTMNAFPVNSMNWKWQLIFFSFF